jgi:hypothetical protein
MVSSVERQARARLRRGSAVLNKTDLSSVETDLTPIHGADAIALAVRLTVESWSLSGQPEPTYTRSETPFRFVPGRMT